ncbi:hypothetical protein NPIL_327011 [Nephila pilipes]|uniref:Uncharacterized protein n=1 Tax=Nephila pilipes TaxID=299642 RepID=A0A8X6PDE9_NEPPI|nr:hypothetical protein NPIL_327011 [Nephila pilipes]
MKTCFQNLAPNDKNELVKMHSTRGTPKIQYSPDCSPYTKQPDYSASKIGRPGTTTLLHTNHRAARGPRIEEQLKSVAPGPCRAIADAGLPSAMDSLDIVPLW